MDVSNFGSTARSLAKNPLGIIALFIVLVYGFAALVVAASSKLESTNRLPLVWFLVIFPVLVLIEFGWLVSRHHQKLYAPSDYKSDTAFIETFQIRAAAALAAATAKSSIQRSTGEVETSADSAVTLVRAAAKPKNIKRSSRTRILWVDDCPENNRLERQSLEALGVKFVIARGTDEVFNALDSAKFDLVISDLSRPPDDIAGLRLLDALRLRGIRIPYIIYGSERALKYGDEARKKGALGVMSRADELFKAVLTVISSRPSALVS
jgi:CheY-like chemotaxis protein